MQKFYKVFLCRIFMEQDSNKISNFLDLKFPRISGETDIGELQELGVLYHGTPMRNVPRILKRGLLTKYSTRGYLCLTHDLNRAIYFTNFVQDLFGVNAFGVFCIGKNELPVEIKTKLEADPLFPEGLITFRNIPKKYIQKIILANQGVRKHSFENILRNASELGKTVQVIEYDL